MTRVQEFLSKVPPMHTEFNHGEIDICWECDLIKPLYRGGICQNCWEASHD